MPRLPPLETARGSFEQLDESAFDVFARRHTDAHNVADDARGALVRVQRVDDKVAALDDEGAVLSGGDDALFVRADKGGYPRAAFLPKTMCASIGAETVCFAER